MANNYPSTDSRFMMPKEDVIPPFIAERSWTKEDFVDKMELSKVKTQKDEYYAERKAFSRWVSAETNYYGVWKKVMEQGNKEMATSLALSLLGEFKLFCEKNRCPEYVRQAENFYRRGLNLIEYHFSHPKK